MRHRIFFPLLLVLSATAFSASAMAASDSPPPDNTKHSSSSWPPMPAPYIRPPWCDKWPQDIEKPLEWCQICGC
ncbi:hypothetical protein G9618_002235 [Salmonella enterica]|nr:hypothetical protein [Salmonella enterica]EEK8649329.1 hypothetical protein [Salmonella enterica]EMF2376068.1 hypothetical protein [Salmonella enterica]